MEKLIYTTDQRLESSSNIVKITSPNVVNITWRAGAA